MKTSFKVELISFNKISYLPNSWNNEDYINLLEIMDYGDISDIPQNELKDMCFMLLTDNEPEEAATIILKYIFIKNNRFIKNCILVLLYIFS